MLRQVADELAAEDEGGLRLHVRRMGARASAWEMLQFTPIRVGAHNKGMGFDLSPFRLPTGPR